MSVSVVPLREANRHEASRLYAALQADNSLFDDLAATPEDLYRYGQFLYDMAAPHGLACAAVSDEDGALLGLNLTLPVVALAARIKEGAVAGLKCAAHVHLCGFLQRILLSRWGGDPATLSVSYFSGVSEQARGLRLYPRMVRWSREHAVAAGQTHFWGFFKDSKLIEKGFVSATAKGSYSHAVAGTVADLVLRTPAWLLDALRNVIAAFADMRGTTGVLIDTASFRYEGRYPFGKNLVMAGVFELIPKESHLWSRSLYNEGKQEPAARVVKEDVAEEGEEDKRKTQLSRFSTSNAVAAKL